MGRKYLSDLKTNKITIKISDYELEILKKAVKEANVTTSKYVRELIRSGGNIDLNYVADRTTLIRQISGIATNINQITKKINTVNQMYGTDLIKIEHYLEEVQKLFREVLTLWQSRKS